MLDMMGQAYSNLGQHAQAQALLERALATWRRLLGLRHADVGTTLRRLGDVRGGRR